MRNHAAQLAIIKQLSRQELHSTAGNCQADVSAEIRDQIRVFLKENGRQLRNEQSLTADYYRNSFGNFEAHLAVREKNEPVVDIRLTVPDAPTAIHITEAWREKNQEIYAFLIENLF